MTKNDFENLKNIFGVFFRKINFENSKIEFHNYEMEISI